MPLQAMNLLNKCIRDRDNVIVYLANPSGENPETDFPAATVPEIELYLENGNYQVFWFDTDTGNWVRSGRISGGQQKFIAPSLGDWVLLIKRVG